MHDPMRHPEEPRVSRVVSQPDREVPPSSHTTDHLANERTFLAWIRTSVALISLGFVVAKFSVWLRQFLATVTAQRGVTEPIVDAGRAVALPKTGASLPAGLALMAFGALVAVLALVRHQAVGRAIDRGEFHPAHGLVWLVTIAVVLAAVAFIVYLAATAPRF